MSNYAIIVAAGKGKRFGQTKQFYPLKRRPLILYALEPFETNPYINDIVVVVPRRRIPYTNRLITGLGYKKIRHIVAGGKQRQDSVLSGLNKLKRKSGIVAIHDGCRPLVRYSLINRGIKLCHKYQAVIFGVPVHDTIKRVKKHHVQNTVPRRGLYLIQTPQFFDINLIRSAYAKADLSIDYTDEAAMLESLGWPVYCFLGNRFNIKITEKNDVKIITALLP
jgi:2-C-methyl-D-erythritol 4-phosphate cytidylyltransferase